MHTHALMHARTHTQQRLVAKVHLQCVYCEWYNMNSKGFFCTSSKWAENFANVSTRMLWASSPGRSLFLASTEDPFTTSMVQYVKC